MAHDNHASTPPQVPADMVAQRLTGWHLFTRGMFWNAVTATVVLVFLLLVAKVL